MDSKKGFRSFFGLLDPEKIDSYINFLHLILFLCILKVRQFKHEVMKSSFLPKYDQKIIRISALCSEGRNCSYFGRNDDFINSFLN